jgi:predicted Zn-dependent protease
VALIENGRVVGRVHDVVTAATAGVEPTGHTAPPGWRFGRGPAPMHVLVGRGAAGLADLEAVVGDGIAVQRVDYVRIVQPRQGLVTGTTRDATVRIRSGRRAEALAQFRFTLRLADLFAAVEAVGRDRERSDAPFIDSITAPAMVVSAFPIDSEARR